MPEEGDQKGNGARYIPMQSRRTHHLIAWTILILLTGTTLVPARAGAAGASGKKAFQAGQKLEGEGKFDEAAELYLMAVAQETNKPEYTIALRRSSSAASVMLVRKGRELMEQGKFEDAYNAFRRAYQFDQTNDLAKDLAKKALDRQRQVEGITPVPVKAQPYGSSADYGQSNRNRPPGQTPGAPNGEKEKKDTSQVISYRDKLRSVIQTLARQLDLNVAFDNTFQDKDFSIELRNVTKGQALDIILQTQGLFFTPMGDNTIIVAQDNTANRNRLQNLSVQTFFLRNADPQQVQQQVAALFGNRVLVVPSNDLRAISVRTSSDNLKLIDQIVGALDKNRPEVLIDVSIYEVSRSDTVEIGNQLLFDGFLGQGAGGVPRPSSLNFLGVTAGQVLTSGRFALAIPSTVIRFLQNKGTSRLVDSLQVHALDGQQVTANVGQRVPIQTASLPFGLNNATGTTTTPGGTVPGQTSNPALGLYGGIPQIDYQAVGLNVQLTPTIYSDDDVKLEMSIESSSLAASSISTLTPTITTRTLKSFATVKTGQAAMMAGVAQKRAGQARAGIPILGFLPVIGRFFSVPKDTNDTTDLIITVTPHIVRAADISDQDRLARLAGTQNSGGLGGSIENFLEDRDSRRPVSTPVGSPTTTTTTAEVRPSPFPAISPLPVRTEYLSPLFSALQLTGGPVATAAVPVTSETVAPLDRVNVLLHPDLIQPKVGESLQLEVLVQANGDVREGVVALTFDPEVLRAREVADGGMMGTVESPAQILAQKDSAGRLLVSLRGGNRPAVGTTARGRLVVVAFDVVSSGSATIRVDEAGSRFVMVDGRTAPCSSLPLTIKAR